MADKAQTPSKADTPTSSKVATPSKTETPTKAGIPANTETPTQEETSKLKQQQIVLNCRDNDKYKLVEVSQDIINELEEGNGSVSIKGKPGDEAVLCTHAQTYSIRLAVSSNSLLLAPKEGPPADISVHASLSAYYELTKTAPRLHTLYEVLRKTQYDGAKAEEDMRGEQYTFNGLSAFVQASDRELRQGLKDIDAFELNGFWRILKPSFSAEVVDLLLTHGIIKDWQLSALDEQEVLSDMSEYDSRILLHILATYGNRESNGKWKLDIQKLSVFRATQLLTLGESGKDWRVSDFMTAWRDSAPDGAPVDMELLRGLAVVAQQGKESMVRYLSAADLRSVTTDAKERIRQLFKIQPRWTLPDMLPYLSDLAPNQPAIQNILLKHARTINSAGTTLYCSRDSSSI